MKLAELQMALRAADAGAVLVPPRILEQIIRDDRNLRGSVWSPPHKQCYVVERQVLFRHIEQTYLDLEPDQLLPSVVILLARPPSEELSAVETKPVLLKYWRLLFHASIHQALDSHYKDDPDRLPPARIGAIVEELGRAEFDEIREILVQDRYLVPDCDDREVYIEFAAVYLENRYFSDSMLPSLFPGIRDFKQIDRLLAQDVDAESLFRRSRLKDAPDPVMPIDPGSEESESLEQYWTLVRNAERANLAKDNVLAAILRTRAARIAPAAHGQQTREEAQADMRRLTERLAAALRLTPEEEDEWGHDLLLLLDKADQGRIPAEARLLFDLQRVCSDSERHIFALDPVEWFLSAGRRQFRRPLPSLRQVRITRSLRSAMRYMSLVRLHETDRKHLTSLVYSAVSKAEDAVRDQFGRVLTTALQDVGANPANAPERVAMNKMVEEWLDRIISHGFITFSDLRDTISRNQLKMPDLRDPTDLIRGDPLLRLDRRLASLLDGVYRPSDVYMRWLERSTAVNFGTKWGRALTLWVTIPFGAAALLLQAFGILFHLLVNPERHTSTLWMYHVLVGPSREAGAKAGPHLPWHFLLLGMIGVFLMAVIHVPRVRQRCHEFLEKARRDLRRVLIEIPREFLRKASLQEFLRSWQFQVLLYVLKPLFLTGIIWAMMPHQARNPGTALVLFVISSVLVNSRIGKALIEAGAQALRSLGLMLRAGLLVALFRVLMRVFKQVIDGVELVLFTVDDWLRFRKGDTTASLVVRTILGVLWFPVSYLARFCMLVLIEPGFNPAKAPVSYVAAKVMLPLAPHLTTFTAGALRPFLGHWLAYAIAVPMIWLLPDVFGFLFWETKENWSLYRANRRKDMHAASVGPRGETVKALLVPGFHSGVIPRLYQRLRDAERHAAWSRNWAGARACRDELEEISRSLYRFVCRELVAMLDESPGWQKHQVDVPHVDLSVKRVRITLMHAEDPQRSVLIDLELRHTLLVACVRDTGWLDQLTTQQLNLFTAELASFYKLAGVDLVVEQIQANLPSGATWDVIEEGLSVRLDRTKEPVVYNLHELDLPPMASSNPATEVAEKPPIDPKRLVFTQYALNWSKWVTNWTQPAGGDAAADDAWHHQLVNLEPPARGLRIDFQAAASSTDKATQEAAADLDPRILRETDLELRTGRPA